MNPVSEYLAWQAVGQIFLKIDNGKWFCNQMMKVNDFSMKLDLSNRSLIMEVDNQKIIIDGNLGDFDYSPIVILSGYDAFEVTL